MSKPIKLSFNRYEYWGKCNGYQRENTKYYIYKVFLNGFCVYENNQLNHFNEYFKKHEDTLAEAQKYVYGLSNALGIPFPKLITFRKEIVPQVEQWIEVNET